MYSEDPKSVLLPARMANESMKQSEPRHVPLRSVDGAGETGERRVPWLMSLIIGEGESASFCPLASRHTMLPIDKSTIPMKKGGMW